MFRIPFRPRKLKASDTALIPLLFLAVSGALWLVAGPLMRHQGIGLYDAAVAAVDAGDNARAKALFKKACAHGSMMGCREFVKFKKPGED